MSTDITADEDRLLQGIRAGGLRLTLPRRAICRILATSEAEFLTASEILEQVEGRAGRIDASTVYRTLDELVRLGLLHHVHLGNQPGAWHITLDEGDHHLVCESCLRPIAVPMADLAPIFDVIRNKYGFTPNPRLTIVGRCASCADQEAS